MGDFLRRFDLGHIRQLDSVNAQAFNNWEYLNSVLNYEKYDFQEDVNVAAFWRCLMRLESAVLRERLFRTARH